MTSGFTRVLQSALDPRAKGPYRAFDTLADCRPPWTSLVDVGSKHAGAATSGRRTDPAFVVFSIWWFFHDRTPVWGQNAALLDHAPLGVSRRPIRQCWCLLGARSRLAGPTSMAIQRRRRSAVHLRPGRREHQTARPYSSYSASLCPCLDTRIPRRQARQPAPASTGVRVTLCFHSPTPLFPTRSRLASSASQPLNGYVKTFRVSLRLERGATQAPRPTPRFVRPPRRIAHRDFGCTPS